MGSAASIKRILYFGVASVCILACKCDGESGIVQENNGNKSAPQEEATQDRRTEETNEWIEQQIASMDSEERWKFFQDRLRAFEDGACSRDSALDCHKDVPSTVMKPVRGRLGNHMWGLMMAVAFHLSLGLNAPIAMETVDSLGRFFKPIADIPILERDECGFATHNKAFKKHLDTKVVEFYEEKLGTKVMFERDDTGRLTIPVELNNRWPMYTAELIKAPGFVETFHPTFDDVSPEEAKCAAKWELFERRPFDDLMRPEWRRNRHIHLFPSKIEGDHSWIYLYPNFSDIFASKLQFKDDLAEEAQAKLHKIKLQHLGKVENKKKGKKKKKSSKKKDVVFVGIHCRLTDHIDFEIKQQQKPVSITYYLEAMILFREHFKGSEVVFVFVSDDMKWGREKLRLRNKEDDLYFGGDGDPDADGSIGADLALLAACNHTIQSYGSFSYMAGFLAGGMKIIPEHFAEYRTTPESRVQALTKHPLKHPLPRLYFFSQMQKQIASKIHPER